MPQDYSRLQRADWDKAGATALAQEIFIILNTAGPTADTTVAEEGEDATTSTGAGNAFSATVVSGSGEDYVIELHTGDEVDATVPGILATETVPVGATGVAIQDSDGNYQFHFPLWVEMA